MTRLETIAPRLCRLLEQSDEPHLRLAAQCAVAIAISRAQVDNQLVLRAMQEAAQSRRLSKELLAAVEQLGRSYESMYYNCLDREGGDEMVYFVKARAIAALIFSVKSDPFESASESIYEACATSHETTNILAAIESVLRRDRNDSEKE